MQTFNFTRGAICFWMTLLAMVMLAAASPAPIDSGMASVIASNLNLGCVNGCPAAASVQQLNSNAALGSSTSPYTLVGAVILAVSVLTGL